MSEFLYRKKNLFKKPIFKYASRLIPYCIQDDHPFILLGLSTNWDGWTPLGGMCQKEDFGKNTQTMLYNCLRRELKEESRELIDIDLDISGCKEINYMEYIEDRIGKRDVHNFIYFVEWNDREYFEKQVFPQFIDSDRNNKLKQDLIQKNINPKYHFEMKEMDFIKVNSERFARYLINTLVDEPKRLKEIGDERWLKYINENIGHLFEKYKDYKSVGKTNLDIRFVTGLVIGLSKKYKKKYESIEEIIVDFENYLLEQDPQCFYS